MIPSSEELREVAGLREGSLRATPFSVLLLALSARHRSLALEMRRKQINKRIVLEHGTPVDCRSNLVHETLGRYMVSLGKLTPEDLHTYLGQSASAGQPLGEVLLEHDVVTAEELFKLLQQNLAKKLLDIFTWRDGEFRIHEDSGAVESPLKIRVPQLVVTGITKFAPQEEVDAGVVPLVGKKLVLHPTPPFPLDEVRLTQRQTQVAVALRSGGWRIDELALGTAMPFEEITRLLYALALLGVVVTAEHPAAKAASRTSRTAVLPLPAADAAAASPLGAAADAPAASPLGADAAPPGATATPVSAGAGAGPAAFDIADLSLAPPAADDGATSTAAPPSAPAAAAAVATAGAAAPATTQPPSRATRPAAHRSGDETTPPTGTRTVGPRDTRAAATRPMPIMPLDAATLDASAADLDAPAASAPSQDPAATGDRTVATDHAATADAAASAPAARAADRAPGTGGSSPAPTAAAAIASPNAGGAPRPATSPAVAAGASPPATPPATAPPPDLAAIVASLSTAGGTTTASVPALAPPPPPPPPAPNRNEIMQIYLSYRRLDAFDLLGVDEDASPAAVEAKYLEAARRFAPWDLTGPAADLEEKARDIFLATSRAYAELLDLEQRNALLFRRQAKRDERGRRSPDMAIKTDLLDPEVQYRKGRAFMDAGKFQEAAVLLEFASDCDPQNGLYSAELAYCRFCLAPSHGARAIKELEETLRRDADCGLAVYYTGEIHRQLGNRDEAEKNLRRAIKMMSPDRRPIEALKLLSAEKRR